MRIESGTTKSRPLEEDCMRGSPPELKTRKDMPRVRTCCKIDPDRPSSLLLIYLRGSRGMFMVSSFPLPCYRSVSISFPSPSPPFPLSRSLSACLGTSQPWLNSKTQASLIHSVTHSKKPKPTLFLSSGTTPVMDAFRSSTTPDPITFLA